MIKQLFAALGLVGTLVLGSIGMASPVAAQASYQILDANSVKQNVKSFNCSSMICPLAVLADTSGNQIGTTSNPLYVGGASGATFAVTGTFWQTTQPVSGTFWPYSLGQQLAASSVPVVLTAAQITALTPPTSVGISGTLPGYTTTPTFNCGTGCAGSNASVSTTGTTTPASATLVGMAQSGNLVGLTGTSGSLNVNITGGGGSGGTSSNYGSAFPAAGTALGLTNGTNMIAWSATSNYGTSPGAIAVPSVNAAVTNTVTVSGAVTANAGTNLNTSLLALESGGNLATIVTNTGRIPAQGQALAAASTPVVLTALQVAALTPPAAITGFALDTSVGTTNTDLGALGSTACATDNGSCNLNALIQRNNQRLTTINTTLGTPIQTTGGTVGLVAGSAIIGKVGIDQTTPGTTNLVAAGQNGTWNITNISGTISLPTGAATSANQATANALLGTNSATTTHTCSTAGFSALSCLGQIDDDVKTGTGPLNAAAASSTSSVIIGAQYLSTQPTMTNTQQAALLLSTRGELLVAPGASGFAVTLNATPSLANGNGVVPTQGGTALSATNGSYANILQGNAVLSQTNPSFASVTDGTNKAAVKAASTPSPATDASLSVTINAGSNGLIGTGGQTTANSVPTVSNSQYPVNSVTTSPTPVGAVATGTTGSVVATIGATASVTNFLCDFDVSFVGGVASGQVTITGLAMGTRTYNITSATTPGLLTKSWSPCLPASAPNTAIVITSPALTAATANDVNASGYRL